MSRTEQRKAKRQAVNIVTKAKKDMIAWVETLDYMPSQEEMKAWQAGYIAGINRLAKEEETDD